MNLSREEAEAALREIQISRVAIRRAIVSQGGHRFVWLWGFVWAATGVMRELNFPRFWVYTNWITVVGVGISLFLGFSNSRNIRFRVDRRFLAVCATLLVFGYGIWPFFFAFYREFDKGFAYQEILWMQLYIVAGIWWDNNLLWVGLLVTVVTLVGIVAFPAHFGVAIIASGATLIASGFYLRSSWK
jgi:hypothetical protein